MLQLKENSESLESDLGKVKNYIKKQNLKNLSSKLYDLLDIDLVDYTYVELKSDINSIPITEFIDADDIKEDFIEYLDGYNGFKDCMKFLQDEEDEDLKVNFDSNQDLKWLVDELAYDYIDNHWKKSLLSNAISDAQDRYAY